MRAHVIIDGKVSNTIIVDSLDFMPRLIDASQGGSIGDIWDGSTFSKPPITAEQIATEIAALRALRNAKLSQSDWTQLPNSPVDKAVWEVYRQALRDIPTQSGFPDNVIWPTQPE